MTAKTKKHIISEQLRELDERHYDDGDGGYVLLGEVIQYAKKLCLDDKDFLRQELLRLVDVRDRTMWGIALECLVQEWSSRIAADLNCLLSHENRTEEWEDQVLMALLRLRYKPVTTRAIAHISKRIAAHDRTVLPLLAALCKVESEDCLKLMAPFFIRIVNDGQKDKLPGYIPSVVSHLLDADPNLLALLLRRIAAENGPTAVCISQLFCEYLARPYVVEKLGKEKADLIEKSLKGERANNYF